MTQPPQVLIEVVIREIRARATRAACAAEATDCDRRIERESEAGEIFLGEIQNGRELQRQSTQWFTQRWPSVVR